MSTPMVRSAPPMPSFVYHVRQPNMIRTTLYSLNTLKALHPALYERQVGKYAGREAVLNFRTPLLDILWNDAAHTSGAHPAYLVAAWESAEVGMPFREYAQFFKIPWIVWRLIDPSTSSVNPIGPTPPPMQVSRWPRPQRSSHSLTQRHIKS
jgi:hypothetical protein